MNSGADLRRLLDFLAETLPDPQVPPAEEVAVVRAGLERLADWRNPQTSDELYDRLADGVVLWARAHPEPVAHECDRNFAGSLIARRFASGDQQPQQVLGPRRSTWVSTRTWLLRPQRSRWQLE